MKTFFLIMITFSLVAFSGMAQDKPKVYIHILNKDGKVIDKTFNSVGELKNDEELKKSGITVLPDGKIVLKSDKDKHELVFIRKNIDGKEEFEFRSFNTMDSIKLAAFPIPPLPPDAKFKVLVPDPPHPLKIDSTLKIFMSDSSSFPTPKKFFFYMNSRELDSLTKKKGIRRYEFENSRLEILENNTELRSKEIKNE